MSNTLTITKKENPLLYKYLRFLVKLIPDKNLKDSSLDKDAKRYLLVTDSDGVTTDGFRLHQVSLPKDSLAPGYYKAVRNTASQIDLVKLDEMITVLLKFPDWQKLLRSMKFTHAVTMIDRPSNHWVGLALSVLGEYKITMNHRYIEDALVDSMYYPTIFFNADEKGTPIKIEGKCDDMRAYIMPIVREWLIEVRRL